MLPFGFIPLAPVSLVSPMRARNQLLSVHGSGHLLRCDDGYKPSSSDFYLARAVLCAARSALRERREIESQTLIYSQPPLLGGSN